MELNPNIWNKVSKFMKPRNRILVSKKDAKKVKNEFAVKSERLAYRETSRIIRSIARYEYHIDVLEQKLQRKKHKSKVETLTKNIKKMMIDRKWNGNARTVVFKLIKYLGKNPGKKLQEIQLTHTSKNILISFGITKPALRKILNTESFQTIIKTVEYISNLYVNQIELINTRLNFFPGIFDSNNNNFNNIIDIIGNNNFTYNSNNYK